MNHVRLTLFFLDSFFLLTLFLGGFSWFLLLVLCFFCCFGHITFLLRCLCTSMKFEVFLPLACYYMVCFMHGAEDLFWVTTNY